VVVSLDGRGTPGRGKAFQDAFHGRIGQGEIADHAAALRQAAAHRPWMDLDRVGVVGHSWGGYFALRALLTAADLYRVGVASAPAVDLEDFRVAVEPYMGCFPENCPEAYRAGSNTRLLDRLEGELLLLHGTADRDVPVGETLQLVDLLNRVGERYDLVLFPGSSHGIPGNPTWWMRTTGFLTEALGVRATGSSSGAEDLRPASAPEARPLVAQTPWPAEGWPRAEPEAVGLNPAVLDSIDAEIRAGEHGRVDRLLVIRRGRLAYDRRYEHDYERVYGDSARAPTALNDHHPTGPYNYFSAWWHPYYRDGDLHTLQSITKTVTSIAIGTAVTRGDFPSLDTPVVSFFDTTAVANLDERKKRMTIRHLLTMTAGLDWDEMRPYGDTANTADQMEASYDWVEFTIDRPMSDEPGSRFNYSSGATQLLAHVFYRTTGVDLETYAARHLFAPLGIRDWHWKRAPSGIVDAEGGLYLAPEDLARLWYLFLRDGAWDGSRIVSSEWVRSSVAPTVTDVDPGMPPGSKVGLTWWLVPNPTDRTRHMWVGAGFGGQLAFAIPEDDLIVIVHQWNIVPGRPQLDPDRTIERILGAVTDRGPGGSPPVGRTSPPEAAPGTDAADGSRGGPERLVHSSYRPAGWDVYLQGEEGSDPRRLTEHPALDYDATFSPDGRWVVFTSERNGSPDLFALDLEGDDPPRLLLRSPAMEDQADVSPDGEWLVFVGTAGGDADVYRLPFRPHTTLGMDDATNLTEHPGGDFRPAFSPDGARIAFSTDRDTPPAPNPRTPFALRREGEIYVMDADGQALTRLTRSPGWDGSPAWSADGETLFFYSERETRGEFRIWALGVEGGEPRAVSPAGRPALSPATGRDGGLAFSTWTESEGDERWTVVSVDAADDSEVRTESDPAMDCLTPDVHPTTGAVVCHGGPLPGGSVADWPGPLLVDGSPETRDMPDRQLDLYAVRKAFAAPPHPETHEIVLKTGRRSLALASIDGSGPSDLVSLDDATAGTPGSQIMQLRWSPDGRWILFTLAPFAGGPSAEADLWKVRPDGSGLTNLTPDAPGNDGLASVSATGDRILFRSGRSGQYDLYLMDADGGNVRRVTRDPAKETFPTLSPGGDRIAFASDRDAPEVAEDGFAKLDLYTAPLLEDGTAGEVRRITDDPGQEAHVEFSPDGAWLVYTSGRGGINDEEPLVQSVLFNPQSYGEIYAYRLEDGATVRLTHNKWEDGAPVWAEASVRPVTPPVSTALEDLLETEGAEAAAARYRELRRTEPDAYRFGEGGLHHLGRRLLAEDRPEIARRAFETLGRVRPEDPRALAGVATAALAAGDTTGAIAAYRWSLEAHPEVVSAEIALFRLGAPGYRPVELSAEELERLTGRYRFAPEAGLEITRAEGGRLSLTLPGFAATLTPVGPLTFFDREAKFVFVADEAGEITGLRIHPDGEAVETLEKAR
jgi:Tol biopolymer transport system component/CubicO group peptidase (beta-lactamase class C family)